jgi:hypothetical protein
MHDQNHLERDFLTLLFVLPILVLCIAYSWIIARTGNFWPFQEIVHEDGKRTLLQTMFYYEHAVRELYIDLILSAGTAGAAYAVHPFSEKKDKRSTKSQYVIWVLGSGCLIQTGLLFFLTGYVEGMEVLKANLFQMHTRPEAPLMFGAHWRYHFLERPALLLLSFFLISLYAYITRKGARVTSGNLVFVFLSVIVFYFLSLVFGVDWAPFIDPQFVGHQARELLTHATVTVPLACGACLLLIRKKFLGTGIGHYVSEGTQSLRPLIVSGGISGVIALYLLIYGVAYGAAGHGQVSGYGALLFPHFFEHFLGYILILTASPFFYLLYTRLK